MPLNTGLTAFAFNSIHHKDTRLYAVQLLVKVPITEQMQHYFQKLEYTKKIHLGKFSSFSSCPHNNKFVWLPIIIFKEVRLRRLMLYNIKLR